MPCNYNIRALAVSPELECPSCLHATAASATPQ